jgi:hypothetical protein
MKRSYDCLFHKNDLEYRILIIEQCLGTTIWHHNALIPKGTEAQKKWRESFTESIDSQYSESSEFHLAGLSMNRAQLIVAIEKKIASALP